MELLPLAVLQFGRFELDLARYELRRGGHRIRLQRVPMELLILLVERRGALVMREDIVTRVWTAEALGDTERSINTAIRKIRQALDDDAGAPRFIETVVGKGYRFIGEIPEIPVRPPEPEPLPASTAPPVVHPRRLPLWAIALGAAVGVAATIAIAARPSRNAPIMKVSPFTALPGSESVPAFSPDGNQVAFSWLSEDGSRQHLYLKSVVTGTQVQLTSTQNRDSDPAWSPDGSWIAFLRHGPEHSLALYLMPSSGGIERKVYEFSHAYHFRPAWSADGSRVAVLDSGPPDSLSTIFLISIHSGEKRRLTTAAPTSTGDWSPAFSPDGRTLAYLHNTGSLGSSLPYSLPVDPSGLPGGQPRAIQTDRVDCGSLAWTADGHSLICPHRGVLSLIPAEGGRTEELPFHDATEASMSPRGNRLVYVQSVRDTDVFRAPGAGEPGTITKLISSTRMDGGPRYSPDGKRIAFISERTGSEQLWVADSEGQHSLQLTSMAGAGAGCPRWSPDGLHITFDSNQDGLANIYVVDTEGGSPRRITSGNWNGVRPSWSGDGKWIYFGSDRSGAWEIWKTPAQGGTPVRVTYGGGREAYEDFEGTFLYYTKVLPVRGIWRLRLAGGAEEPVIDEGSQGRWAIGARGVYYLSGDDNLEFREASSGRRVPMLLPGLRPGTGAGGGLLSIGPNDRWILITGLVRSDSDLTLVENLRF